MLGGWLIERLSEKSVVSATQSVRKGWGRKELSFTTVSRLTGNPLWQSDNIQRYVQMLRPIKQEQGVLNFKKKEYSENRKSRDTRN